MVGCGLVYDEIYISSSIGLFFIWNSYFCLFSAGTAVVYRKISSHSAWVCLFSKDLLNEVDVVDQQEKV